MGNTISSQFQIQLSSFPSILAVIGLNILFKPSKKQSPPSFLFCWVHGKSDGNDIDVTFSTVTKYLNDQHFTRGSADVSMGEASVYFDNCRIEGPSAQFVVDVSLGSLSLYVPSDWRVHVNVDNSLSAIQHQENPSALTSKDFYITGDVSLGNLEIIYVGSEFVFLSRK